MKKVYSIILSLILLCCLSLTSYAVSYIPIGNYRLSGGVGNSGNNTRYYWLDSSITAYTSTVNSAMYAWNHTANTPGVTTKIWFQPVASKSSSIMDIYSQTPYSSYIFGETSFYGQAYNYTPIAPSTQNWVWCKVTIFTGNFTGSNNTNSYGYTMQSTVAHEMGHVFGLNENNTISNCVMAQTGTRNVGIQGPTANDCYCINYMYP